MDREGVDKLAAIVGKENVKDGGIWRGVYGRDASYYGIEPECVVRPRSAEEVEKIIKYASESGKHITFRSGGTSLCGQALGTGIVCEVRGNMRRAEVRDNGRRIWFEPGLTVNEVNRYLRSHHAKIGPDPASSSAAMMGGVLANNSTCCGAAGDRGFIYPEVARKALSDEKAEIGDKQYDGYYSLARTCEISMMDTIGRPYESIVYLVDETTA